MSQKIPPKIIISILFALLFIFFTGNQVKAEGVYDSCKAGILQLPLNFNYSMGYKFTLSEDGQITKLCGFFSGTRTVNLYSSAYVVLASASVTANGTISDWVCSDIAPVNVNSGQSYFVIVYSGSGAYYRTGETLGATKVCQGITINYSVWQQPSGTFNASHFPSYSTMYGMADIVFIPRHTLSVAKSGTGSGVVTSSPAGIDCGADCDENYNSGTVVTLTATKDVGSDFVGWSGDCSGVGDCIVVMDGDKNVTAEFVEAIVGTVGNVSGFAWSENIGWISFNSNNCDTDGDGLYDGSPLGCPASGNVNPYSVDIDSNGYFYGYAWSENIGWIKFDPAPDFVSGVYPTCPVSTCPSGSPNYPAKLNPVTKKITGWARACAGTVNGDCNSATRSNGWDGWILLGPINNGGTDYGSFLDDSVNPNQFHNWAWGSDVVGWISFNCLNQGVCGASDYKVIVSFSSIPGLSELTYSFANHCSQSRIPVLSWNTDAADPQYEIEILTTGITGSGLGKEWSPACNGCCDVFPYNNVAFGGGTYTWRVRVRDGGGPWSDWEQSTFATRLNCDPVASFDISAQNPSAEEEVSATSTSQAFGGATISSCLWEITPPAPGGGTFVLPTTENSCNPKIKFSISATSLKLTATDSSGYSCDTTKPINVQLPLPDWTEVSPVSFLNKLLVAILNFLKF